MQSPRALFMVGVETDRRARQRWPMWKREKRGEREREVCQSMEITFLLVANTPTTLYNILVLVT